MRTTRSSFRAKTVAEHIVSGGAGGSIAPDGVALALPIFVVVPVLPLGEEEFNIFEPRYRLLLERCLQRRGPCGHVGEFGMCWPVPGAAGAFSEVGTVVRITDHVTYPDGRSHVRCSGVRRFRVLERGSESGLESSTNTEVEFPTADIEWFDDEQVDHEPELGLGGPESEGLDGDASAGGSPPSNTVQSARAREHLVSLHAALLQAYPKSESKFFLLRIHGLDAYKKIADDLEAARSLSVVIDAPADDVAFTWWVLARVAVLPPAQRGMLVLSRSPLQRLRGATLVLEKMAEMFADDSPDEPEMSLVDDTAAEGDDEGGEEVE